MELEKDMRVIMSSSSDKGGKMVCRVVAVSAHAAMLAPESPDLQAWFVNGCMLGRAHWDACLEILPPIKR